MQLCRFRANNFRIGFFFLGVFLNISKNFRCDLILVISRKRRVHNNFLRTTQLKPAYPKSRGLEILFGIKLMPTTISRLLSDFLNSKSQKLSSSISVKCRIYFVCVIYIVYAIVRSILLWQELHSLGLIITPFLANQKIYISPEWNWSKLACSFLGTWSFGFKLFIVLNGKYNLVCN